MAAVLYAPKGELKLYMNEQQVQWPGVMCMRRTEHCICAIYELTIIIIFIINTFYKILQKEWNSDCDRTMHFI